MPVCINPARRIVRRRTFPIQVQPTMSDLAAALDLIGRGADEILKLEELESRLKAGGELVEA